MNVRSLSLLWLVGLVLLIASGHAGADEARVDYGIANTGKINVRGDVSIGISEEKLNEAVQVILRKESLNVKEAAKLRAEVDRLSAEIGVRRPAVEQFLRTLREKDVPLAKLSRTLAEIAQRHLDMLDRLAVLDPEDPATKALIKQARTAIEQADYDQAERLLTEAEERDLAAARQLQATADQRFLNAAATRAERGELSLTRLNYLQAAEHFKTAGEQVPAANHEARGHYLNRYAGALQRQGDEKGDNAALLQAIGVYHKALGELTRSRVPLNWAMAQNNLGTALSSLGQRESDTARLEQAVVAYREALKEWTRSRVPLRWATTQNNLGTALSRLGQRESGTARLEQAVAAYKAALDVFREANAGYYLQAAEDNLSRVGRILADRR